MISGFVIVILVSVPCQKYQQECLKRKMYKTDSNNKPSLLLISMAGTILPTFPRQADSFMWFRCGHYVLFYPQVLHIQQQIIKSSQLYHTTPIAFQSCDQGLSFHTRPPGTNHNKTYKWTSPGVIQSKGAS